MTISGIQIRRKKDTQIWGWNENTVAEMVDEATSQRMPTVTRDKRNKGKKPGIPICHIP